MNLTEERKQPLRQTDLQKKKSMLIMHYKGSSQESKSKFDRPNDYINYLSQPELSLGKQFNCLESLRIALTNNTLKWVNEFGTNGLKVLISILETCCNDKYSSSNDKYEKIQYECLRCLRAFMNNTEGLKQVLEQTESIIIVARCLNPNRGMVMTEAIKVIFF